jgi:hypothetical protein
MDNPYESRWIVCDLCEDYWCTLHEKHAYDCDCPSLEEELINDEKAEQTGSD